MLANSAVFSGSFVTLYSVFTQFLSVLNGSTASFLKCAQITYSTYVGDVPLTGKYCQLS